MPLSYSMVPKSVVRHCQGSCCQAPDYQSAMVEGSGLAWWPAPSLGPSSVPIGINPARTCQVASTASPPITPRDAYINIFNPDLRERQDLRERVCDPVPGTASREPELIEPGSEGRRQQKDRSLSLAIAPKIRINPAIRGSQPGAERTVSAVSPANFHLCGDFDVAGPVGPSSRASAF